MATERKDAFLPQGDPQVKSKREQALERLRAKYPDDSFEDDESIYGRMMDDYDNGEKELSDYKEREQALSNLFTSDPRSAQFLTEWRHGKNPVVALVEMFGDDFVEELKNPKKQEELAKASKSFAERIAKEKEYDDLYQKNIEESREMVAQLQTEEGLTDDDINRAMQFIATITTDGILGKVSRESVLMALNALDHDDDVSLARQEGVVQGKNTRIDEKLRKRNRNDGTANLNGQNGVATRQKAGKRSIFDLAKDAYT